MEIHIRRKAFGDDLLFDNFHLSVDRGRFLAISGPSGCGKTTLLRLITGLDRDGDVEITDPPERMAYVFQETRLLPWRTVRENLQLVADAAGIAAPAKAVGKMLESVELPETASLYPDALSLGMKRRVELARALLIRPDLLVLDEPFVSLDEGAASAMKRVLQRVLRDQKPTVLMVSHNPADAAELADDGRDEDDFAYMRNDREYRNLLLFEMPKGDFAYSQVRQLFSDVYYTVLLPELLQSKDETLSAIAAKAIKETKYHLRRSRDWVLRLGDGTEESHKRTQKAVDQLWGYTHELFDMDDTEQLLADEGIGVDVSKLRDAWLKMVSDILTEATITVPEDSWAVRGGRTGYHTENLGHMLTEMQIVHRSFPGCKW